MRISAPSSSVQSTRSGLRIYDVADGLDVAGGDRARALLLHHHALRAFALHLDGDVLDVEDDVGHVLAHAGDRGELVQHAVDLHRLHRRALQRGQQHAAQRVAERQAEAALERLGHHASRRARGSSPGATCSLFGPDQFLPVLLDLTLSPIALERRGACRAHPTPLRGKVSAAADASASAGSNAVRRGGACAAGSRCAGSASRRGST